MKHMTVTREFLMQAIDNGAVNPADIFGEPVSKTDALQALREGPAGYPMGTCDNHTPDGECLGHREKP